MGAPLVSSACEVCARHVRDVGDCQQHSGSWHIDVHSLSGEANFSEPGSRRWGENGQYDYAADSL